MFDHQKVTLVGMTYPTMDEFLHVTNIEEFIDHCARVSNPANQSMPQDSSRLLSYLIRNQHWSPFEMASMTMKIVTTRDIARQILRHRSFSFQEFSQRYAAVGQDDLVCRDCRIQDTKNRQNSLISEDDDLNNFWMYIQNQLAKSISKVYKEAIDSGVAKEQARAILPEGMTKSTLYMAGTVRSWIHYCDLRCGNGTQLEHQDVANKVKTVLLDEMPSLRGYFEDEQQRNPS